MWKAFWRENFFAKLGCPKPLGLEYHGCDVYTMPAVIFLNTCPPPLLLSTCIPPFLHQPAAPPLPWHPWRRNKALRHWVHNVHSRGAATPPSTREQPSQLRFRPAEPSYLRRLSRSKPCQLQACTSHSSLTPMFTNVICGLSSSFPITGKMFHWGRAEHQRHHFAVRTSSLI